VRKLAAVGVLLCAGHAAGFLVLAADPPPPFELFVDAPQASPTLALEAELDPARDPDLAARLRRIPEDPPVPSGAGLRRVRWRAEYRGGYVRSVGASQLVGPFQDPAAPPCSGRVVVGQRLLDDGAAGPGTIAHLVRPLLEAQLAGAGQFPVGDFRQVRGLALSWAEVSAHPDDAAMLAQAVPAPPRGAPPPQGYLRVTATLSFARVDVPITLALIPHLAQQSLGVRIAARARLSFENRALQWLSDLTGADRLASLLARRQLGDLVLSALEPPPPLPLPGGGALRFVPCRQEPQFSEGRFAALPFAVAIEPIGGAPDFLPPLLPAGPTPPASAAPVALELDLNALNALLYGAWRTGFLDRQLGAAGLDARFNEDPTVATYLSVRITAPKLPLPPVVTAEPDGLRLSAEAHTSLRDDRRGEQILTAGRVWTTMRLRATGAPSTPVSETPPLRASLHQLELTCEPRADVLTPCYADLVSAMQSRVTDFDAALTSTLSRIVSGIFVDRTLGGAVAGAELPAELTIRTATPSLTLAPHSATLRLELGVELVAPRP
jgi:hypothetical protein